MPTLQYEQQTSVAPAVAPANAQGAQFTPAFGQAIEEVGHQGSRVASDMARLDFQQKNADAVASLQKNLSDGYRNFAQFEQDQQSKTLEKNPNGAGYTQSFMDAFDKWQGELVEQQPTPQTKRMAAEQARTLGDHYFNRALSWENDTRRNWRTGQLDDSITGMAALLDKDPTAYEAVKSETLGNIQAAAGDLHPQQARMLQERAQREFATSASISWARSHPQDTANAILPTQPLQGGIPAQIADAASKYGVDTQSALAIAQFESHMDPKAVPKDKNGNVLSSAGGIYQQIDSNWAQYGKGGDKFDPAANIDAGMRFMADNTRAFRDTFRREPTTNELYSMHLLGLGGGMALAKADNNQPFSSIAKLIDANHPDTVAANNGFSGMTVGQVKNKIANWMQDATLRTAGMAKAAEHDGSEEASQPTGDLPWLRDISPQERQAVLTHAQSQLHKDDAGARAIVSQQFNDGVAAMQNGQMPPKPVTFDDMVKSGFPAVEAARKVQEWQQWQNYGFAYAKLATQNPSETQAALAAMKPQAGDTDYSLKAQQYNMLASAALQIDRERQFDPIATDQKPSSTNLTRPLDFTTPEFLTGPLSTRFNQAAQVAQTSGTPYAVFSKQEANGLAQFLDKADPSTAAQYLRSIRAAADTPEHFTAAMAQIAPSHPLFAMAGQIADKDPATAEKVLQGYRMMHGEKGEGTMAMPNAGLFKQAWERDRGQAYQGLSDTSNLDMQAAQAYYVATMPRGKVDEKTLDSSTWNNAIAKVSPVANYNGRATLVPAGSKPEEFNDRVAAAWPNALKGYGLDAKDYPASAYTLVSAGQDGYYLPVSGTGFLYAGRQKVVLDLSDQRQAIQQQAAAHVPTEPDTSATRDLKGRKLTVQDLRMTTRREHR